MRRVVSMILTIAILLALASGALAARAAERRFSDWDLIANQAEVAMLADLGLISGYADGCFRPYNSITRAEITKIITCLMTGECVTGNAVQFSDTAGCWASAYIDYCVRQGVISGDTSGLFRPNDDVTARELAKMLLAVLGYRTDGYTGAAWAESVDRDAAAAGIYTGYTRGKGRAITRDEACLLINNALQSSVITGYGDQGEPQYQLDAMLLPRSLLEIRFEVTPVTGVVQANALADLREAGASLEGGRIHVSGYSKDFLVSKQTARDNSLLGHTVTIYAQFGAETNRVVGMPAIRAEEQTFTMNGGQELLAVLDYAGMELNQETQFYQDLQPTDESCINTITPQNPATCIDYEGNGIIDVVMLFSQDDAQ